MRANEFNGKRNICGDRIREARLRRRLSQSDLCRLMQLAGVVVERDTISRMENGGRFVADFEVVTIRIYWKCLLNGYWVKSRPAWECPRRSITFCGRLA